MTQPGYIGGFTIPGRVVPKIRWGKVRGFKGRSETAAQKAQRERIERYKASQDRIRRIAMEAIPTPWPLRVPVLLGVAVFIDPVERGPNKDGLPGNAGDWEGIFGAVADALQKAPRGLRPILAGDDLRWVRGCGLVFDGDEWLASRGYLADDRGERVVVTLWRTE